MKSSQFEAKTFGLGELITQRKLFRVPKHQRSYSWSRESVETFLEDIGQAFSSKATEYFVGLIVMQGPENGEWILLDGQQRLTTVTMTFSAIRNWLLESELPQDAAQIEGEFLSVRRLGGDFSSRMLLNEENQDAYNSLVVSSNNVDSLREKMSEYSRRSSNRLLVDAAIACQEWVNAIASKHGQDRKANAQELFGLASFLESRVKAVSVEVSNEVDAYILFESLNDRGVELSALDLLKNYLYSKISATGRSAFESSWRGLNDLLEDSNPDDFLKVFWTARHGIVQKNNLFRRIRETYSNPSEAEQLVRELEYDADILNAIDEPGHPYWNAYPDLAREGVAILALLGSKQTRPVLLAATHNFSPVELSEFTQDLIVSVVRFQIIGRGRTGVVEKIFGRLCEAISSREVTSVIEAREYLRELYIDDENFINAFASHCESKATRNFYFLWALEGQVKEPDGGWRLAEVQETYNLQRLAVVNDLPPSIRNRQEFREIGNFILLHRHENVDAASLRKSPLFWTNKAADFLTPHISPDLLHERSKALAKLAARVWKFPDGVVEGR